MKKLLIIPVLLALVSCAPAFNNVSFTNSVQAGLLSGSEILLLTPKDGSSGTEIGLGSGAIVASMTCTQLSSRACRVTLDRDHSNILDVDDSTLSNYKYIVVPYIVKWEDNVTAWSGKPDKLILSYDIFDSHRNKITTAEINAQGTSVTMKSTDPSSLIDKPLKEILDQLF